MGHAGHEGVAHAHIHNKCGQGESSKGHILLSDDAEACHRHAERGGSGTVHDQDHDISLSHAASDAEVILGVKLSLEDFG